MRIALALRLGLGACADADGSRPRLSADAPATSAGFDGGYAGTSYGFSDLDTRSTPF